MFDRKNSSVWKNDAPATNVLGPFANDELSTDLCEKLLIFGKHFMCGVTMLPRYESDLKVWVDL
jgi:hypothetical protein